MDANSLPNNSSFSEPDGGGAIRASSSLNNSLSCTDNNVINRPLNGEISSPVAKTCSSPNENSKFYHVPTLSDVLIGYPTQKGFIAYRKPEIGSWYMNAIVQVFSKHSHNTDLCAMLNMVNSQICNEVTNTGKKQMSEYTSNLTKPYLYFFPGWSI